MKTLEGLVSVGRLEGGRGGKYTPGRTWVTRQKALRTPVAVQGCWPPQVRWLSWARHLTVYHDLCPSLIEGPHSLSPWGR